MSLYKSLICPVLDQLDSETMHHAAVNFIHYFGSNPLGQKVLSLACDHKSEETVRLLKTNFAGIELDSPLLVGAGWDKNAKAVFGLKAIGFAGVEIGAVLEHAQPGRPKPRQFVIGPGVAINRLGFNSPGMEVVKKNLQLYHGSGIPIGINVGRNEWVSDDDAPRAFAAVVDHLYDDGCFFTINVSCPNTPNLCHLQNKEDLIAIISAVQAVMDKHGKRKPLFVKVSPDLVLDIVTDIVSVVQETKADGIVATNTTTRSELKAKYGARWENEFGGFSGDDEDYRQMTLKCISHIYKITNGQMAIIGVGGVKDGKTALQKLKAGASVVQVVTGLRGEGLGVARKIKKELAEWMRSNGVKSVKDIIGKELVN